MLWYPPKTSRSTCGPRVSRTFWVTFVYVSYPPVFGTVKVVAVTPSTCSRICVVACSLETRKTTS